MDGQTTSSLRAFNFLLTNSSLRNGASGPPPSSSFCTQSPQVLLPFRLDAWRKGKGRNVGEHLSTGEK